MLAHVFDLLPKAPRAVALPQASPDRSVPVAADALHLLFPPPGAVLSADGAVTIRAMGGRRPLSFLVDGAPLAAEPARREAAWRPQRVGVLSADSAGRRRRGRACRRAGPHRAMSGLAVCFRTSGSASLRAAPTNFAMRNAARPRPAAHLASPASGRLRPVTGGRVQAGLARRPADRATRQPDLRRCHIQRPACDDGDGHRRRAPPP